MVAPGVMGVPHFLQYSIVLPPCCGGFILPQWVIFVQLNANI